MEKTTKKILPFLLALILVFLSVPMPTTAQAASIADATPAEKYTGTQDNMIPKDSYSSDESHTKITEIPSLREANVKHFQMPDGTMQAIIFAGAVHEKDNKGEWQPIDSSITLQDNRGVKAYATKNERNKFAYSIQNEEPIFTITENGYVISVSLDAAAVNNSLQTLDKVKTAAVTSKEVSKKTEWQSIEEAVSAASGKSTIRYPSVYPHTDIEYIVSGSTVKENIILNAAEGYTAYRFRYTLTGLEPVWNKDGSISLLDRTTKEVQYEIPAPYMYDAKGAYSREVSYTLSEEKDGTYVITVVADKDWISDPSREFPVVIDPSLSPCSVLWDTFVNSAAPDESYGDWCVWVGPSYTGLLRSTQASLPAGAKITKGTLNVYYYYQGGISGNRTIGAYQITKSWNESDTYNSLKIRNGSSLGISSTLLATRVASALPSTSASNPRLITFDVTSAVSSWYNGSPNYGIALKHYSGSPECSSNNGTIIYSYEATTEYRAYYAITYQIPNGVYAIKKSSSNVYVKNKTLDSLSWIYQEPVSSPPTSKSDRDYLFKMAYRPATDDYVIRSMSNNAIIIYGSETNNAPVAGKVNVSGAPATDSNLSTGYTWRMTTTSDGYDYIWYKSGDTTYYMRSTSDSGGGPILSWTTNKNDSGTKWSFHKYTGDPIDKVEFYNSIEYLLPGETFTQKAYMYSSTIGRNGPVSYSSQDTSVLTVNSSSGLVTAVAPGSAKVWATYSGASLMWGRPMTVEQSLEGTYYFQNKSSNRYLTPNTGAIVNISNHTEQWDYDYDRDQAWEIMYYGNGHYKIKNIVKNTYLTSPTSKSSEEKITAEALLSSDLDRQLWHFTKQTDGTYQIKAKNRDSYVVTSNNSSNGGNVVQRPATDGDVTKWTLTHWKNKHTDVYIDFGLGGKSVDLLLANSTAQNSTWKPIIERSAEAWNNSGAGVSINILSTGTSNHEIYVQPMPYNTWYGATYPDSYDGFGSLIKSHIVLNTNQLTTDIAQSTVVHEIGHLLWLADNPSSTDNTIMCYERNRRTMVTPQVFDIYNVRYHYEKTKGELA